MMITNIIPKLPMRDKSKTKDFYVGSLGFREFGIADFPDYLMIQRDHTEIHFFLFKDLDPGENYGQVYVRTDNIDELYASLIRTDPKILFMGQPEPKPWGQKEFSILDPDNNLLTFGQRL